MWFCHNYECSYKQKYFVEVGAMKKLYFPKLGIILWTTIIIFTILLSSFANINSLSNFIPQIEIAIVFFAAIYLSVSYWQLFLYGAFIDVLNGSPLGITPFTIILIASILSKFKTNLSKQSTLRILIYFLATLILASILKYLLFSIYFSVRPEICFSTLVKGLMSNIVFYIALHSFLYNKIYMKRYEN
jgi:cell shape-determining protein MreD